MDQQNLPAVLRSIAGSSRPKLINRVFADLVEHMRPDGRVDLTRMDLAERLGVDPNKVTLALQHLEGTGAVFRRHDRRREACATIFINANLATQLTGRERSARQRTDGPIAA